MGSQRGTNDCSCGGLTQMIDLLKFLIAKITNSDDFEISEAPEGEKINFTVSANPSIIGLIIGKGGKTIKNIRKILSIRAVLENKSVNISVTEK